jgi:hypothetical protein
MAQSEKPGTADQGPRRAGVEARDQDRFLCREQTIVRLAVKPTFRNLSALVHDVSTTGIGLLMESPLEPGTILALQLRGGRPGTSLVRTARVLHIRRHLPVKNPPWVKKRAFLQVLLSYLTPGPAAQEQERNFIWLVGCRLSPPLTCAEIEEFCGPIIG